MKKWLVPIAALLALLVFAMGPISALAQSEEEAAPGPKPLWRGSLAIVAPRMAPVGKEISMTVFLRANQEPFEGAGIWALTRDSAEILKEEMAALRAEAGPTAIDGEIEALMNIHGTFLGRTNEDGKLYHTFEEAGGYRLAAVKTGYFPGFTAINVRDMPRALAIESPRQAPVGKEISMTVFQRGTQEPVEDAGVWALSRDKVESLREEFTALREDSSLSAEEKDYEALVSRHGNFLGRTDEAGQLVYAFSEAGGYLLIAVKRGYVPGFAPIGIRPLPEALSIVAPRQALVGDEVTMTVRQRFTEDPVQGAGIWALTRDNIEVLREKLKSMRAGLDMAAAQELDYESLVSIHGTFLGRTDEDGQLGHVFNEAGGYLLITVKRGYFPGFAPIGIRPLPKSDILQERGVPGNGLEEAPGLQKPFNEQSPAEENAGQE